MLLPTPRTYHTLEHSCSLGRSPDLSVFQVFDMPVHQNPSSLSPKPELWYMDSQCQQNANVEDPGVVEDAFNPNPQ